MTHPMTLFQRQGRSSTHIKQKMHHDLKVFSSKLRGMKKKTGCRQVEQQQKKDNLSYGLSVA
jgi:hypothetical protein